VAGPLDAFAVAAAALVAASPALGERKHAVDHEHGFEFTLSGRVLKTTALTRAARRAVYGKEIDAICATAFTGRPPKVITTRRWPRGKPTVRFRFRRDVSDRAKWCLLEDGALDVAAVDFEKPPQVP
jgi:hypothetical protein